MNLFINRQQPQETQGARRSAPGIVVQANGSARKAPGKHTAAGDQTTNKPPEKAQISCGSVAELLQFDLMLYES